MNNKKYLFPSLSQSFLQEKKTNTKGWSIFPYRFLNSNNVQIWLGVWVRRNCFKGLGGVNASLMSFGGTGSHKLKYVVVILIEISHFWNSFRWYQFFDFYLK